MLTDGNGWRDSHQMVRRLLLSYHHLLAFPPPPCTFLLSVPHRLSGHTTRTAFYRPSIVLSRSLVPPWSSQFPSVFQVVLRSSSVLQVVLLKLPQDLSQLKSSRHPLLNTQTVSGLYTASTRLSNVCPINIVVASTFPRASSHVPVCHRHLKLQAHSFNSLSCDAEYLIPFARIAKTATAVHGRKYSRQGLSKDVTSAKRGKGAKSKKRTVTGKLNIGLDPQGTAYSPIVEEYADDEMSDMEDGPNRIHDCQGDRRPRIGSETYINFYGGLEMRPADLDEVDGASIGRALSPLSANNSEEEISFGSKISDQYYPRHGQPNQDEDDRESVGSEIRVFVSTLPVLWSSPVLADDGDVGMDFDDDDASVGNYADDKGWSEPAQAVQRTRSEMSLDLDEADHVSVGSEIIPDDFGWQNEIARDTLRSDHVMADSHGEPVATSIQPHVRIDHESESVWNSLLDYRSSDDEDEAFSSPEEPPPLPLQPPQPQCAGPTPNHGSTPALYQQPPSVVPPEQGGPVPRHQHRAPLRTARKPHQQPAPECPAQPGQGGTVSRAVPAPRQQPTLGRPPQPGQGGTAPRVVPAPRQQPPLGHPAQPRQGGRSPHRQPALGRPARPGQGGDVPPYHRSVPPPPTAAAPRQQPAREHPVQPGQGHPSPRQQSVSGRPTEGTVPLYHRPVPPPPAAATPRQQPARDRPAQPGQGGTLPPYHRPVPPPPTAATSRQPPARKHPAQPGQGGPSPHQPPIPGRPAEGAVPPYHRPVPPPPTAATSRQQPAREHPAQPGQGGTVPPHHHPVPPPPPTTATPRQQPAPGRSTPSAPQQARAAPASDTPPSQDTRRTARKYSNIGLPKRKPKSDKLEIACAVRALLKGLEESGALPEQVQQFQRHQLPRYGPRAGVLEYDTVGTMGSEWNKRLTDVTLELCSTDPLLAVANAPDVLRALKTHLRHRRGKFIETALNRFPDPDLVEQKRIDINRYNRQHHRHNSRLSGLTFFAHDPSVRQNLKLMEEMDPAIHSEDESSGGGQLVARHPAWRSRQNIVKDFFQVPDILTFATHFRTIGCKHRLPGRLPVIRTHLPASSPITARIPVGLPENMYDEQWLRRYKEDEPLLYGTLKVQPPINLKSLQFSGDVLRLVEKTRYSVIGTQRMVGK
ncbi:hypothetical protein B0H10DRAFT_1965248 [Mycena sp. CBHHK59/15]|nr:hypothetical protein B0H10DRAFT_1965248 [Mycena sp. CBHHK59/15]